MISAGDFSKKQIVFVFLNRGEKLSFLNDNFVVRREDGKIKFQCTCYRLFLVFAIGHGSLTSGLMQRAKKFGFAIVMMTPSFRMYERVGFSLDGNTVLRKKQYLYDSLDIAKQLTYNKIENQRQALSSIRNKNELQKEAIGHLDRYKEAVFAAEDLHALMGIEGSAAKVYFPNCFNNVLWKRRAPRVKCDMVNSLLDIGYTLLFSFLEALLSCYGFDLYCGVMHRFFYMRKSLVCDIIEPFRPLIDMQIRRAINLKQCDEEDFFVEQGRYLLRWEKNAEYVSWLAKPIMEHKEEIHAYVQAYYRAFMKGKEAADFPVFRLGG